MTHLAHKHTCIDYIIIMPKSEGGNLNAFPGITFHCQVTSKGGNSIQYSIHIVYRGSVCPALYFMGNIQGHVTFIIPLYYHSMLLKAQVQHLRKHILSQQQQQLKINEPEHVHLFHNEP